jgi:hypothetical protein
MAQPLTGRLRQAAFTIGRRFGVGGSTWAYYPPAPINTIADNGAPAQDGTRTAYVVRERDVVYGSSLPAQAVGIDRWRVIAASDADIATGGVLVSQDGSGLAFTIGPLTSDQGYLTGIVEPTTSPL